MWSTIVGMWSTIVGSSTTFGTRTIVGTDYPRSVTHPDVSAVPWHNHSSSFRIGSGCTNQDCTGGGASASIPNGPLYKCWGPLKVPIGAGKLHRFLPEVDMGLVHHMILFAGRCGSRLIYAWARTGQTAPIGLDFDSWDPAAGYGYPLGSSAAGGMPPLTHVSLQIHYQQTSHMPTTDRSGLRIWFSPLPPRLPLTLNINVLMPDIPAREVADNCVACRVLRDGTAYGWRNHAHGLGRDIWSDHFAADGQAREPLGLISSQHPQIIRKFAEPKRLRAGDMLQLHCVYDNTASDRPSGYGSDETGEMCNQYLLSDLRLQMRCDLGGRRRNHTCVDSPHVVVDGRGTAQPRHPVGRQIM